MDNMKKRTAAGTAMALVGGAFWGLSGVCGQYLFQTKEMTATWLVPVRLFVSGLLLLAFFLAKDAKRTLSVWKNKKTAIDLLIYSFAGIMLCQYAYFQTIEWSNAGTATVVQYIGPALIVVFVCITTHRKPLPKEIVAVVLALAGIFVIATHGNPGTLVLSRRALIMGLLSAFAVVVYTVQPVELLSSMRRRCSCMGNAHWRNGAHARISAVEPYADCGCKDDRDCTLYYCVWNDGGIFDVHAEREADRRREGRAVCLHRAGSGDNSVGCVDEGTVCTDGSARICADPGNDFCAGDSDQRRETGRRHQRIKGRQKEPFILKT